MANKKHATPMSQHRCGLSGQAMRWRPLWALWLVLVSAWLLAACTALVGTAPGGSGVAPQAVQSQSATAAGLQPLSASALATLRPGLAVIYYPGFDGRHLDQLPPQGAWLDRGAPGQPIAELNHRFSGEQPVFGSGRNRLVGMRLRGWIRLAAAGPYRFQALSNDGVRVFVGEQPVVEDPEQHADQLSPIGTLRIEQAGWYPLTVEYFQRKGSASLELHWQPPGASGFAPVPPAALGHLP